MPYSINGSFKIISDSLIFISALKKRGYTLDQVIKNLECETINETTYKMYQIAYEYCNDNNNLVIEKMKQYLNYLKEEK